METELFGCDHCEAGRHLSTDWKLPSDFHGIVDEHHAPRRMDGVWGMAELIKISCRLADTAGFCAFPGCEITPFSELTQELPPRERGTFHSELETLAMDVREKINAIESL